MSDQNVQYTLTLRDLLSGQLSNANNIAQRLEGTMGGLQATINKVAFATGIGFSVGAIKDFGADVIDTGSKLETLNNVINYTSSSTKDAAANHEFLQKMIHEYKLPIMETMEGFSGLNAAMMGTSLQGQQARDIFEGVSIGVTAMHLSADKANAVFYALNNMLSNGTVQAQDLKLQLGNAIPGAFGLAAKAMGVTQQKMTDMMKAGEVISTDFVPKFAALMKSEFGAAIPNAVDSTTAKLTDNKNALIELKDKIFTDLEPAIKSSIDKLTKFIHKLKDLWDWLVKHKQLLKDIAFALGVAGGAWLVYEGFMYGALVVTKASLFWQGLQYASITLLGDGMLTASAATKAWAGMQVMLNAAFEANPIGFVIAAIAFFVTWVTFAYNKLSWFRAAVWTLWAVIKEVGSTMIDFLSGMAEGIVGLFTFDVDKINEGGNKAAAAMFGSAKRISEAAKDGWNAGLKDFAQDNPTVAGTNAPKPVVTGGGKPGVAGAAGAAGADTGTSKVSGTKSITINMRIDNLVRELKVSTINMNQAPAKIQELVTQALLSATNDAQIVAGQ